MTPEVVETGTALCGPLYIARKLDGFMTMGQFVDLHCHDHSHVTLAGGAPVLAEWFDVQELGDNDKPLRYTVKRSVVLDPTKEGIAWCEIEASAWHRLTALGDGAFYLCVWPHYKSHTVVNGLIGRPDVPARTKRDEHGRLWHMVDENIVTVDTGWNRGHA